jgi:hypothetical protein
MIFTHPLLHIGCKLRKKNCPCIETTADGKDIPAPEIFTTIYIYSWNTVQNYKQYLHTNNNYMYM